MPNEEHVMPPPMGSGSEMERLAADLVSAWEQEYRDIPGGSGFETSIIVPRLYKDPAQVILRPWPLTEAEAHQRDQGHAPKPVAANAGESSGPDGGPVSAEERDSLLYEKGVRGGQELADALYLAAMHLVQVAHGASAEQDACIACGTRQDSQHDPMCAVDVAAFQVEAYRQRSRQKGAKP